MKRVLLNGFNLNVDYALALVNDLPDKLMTAQPNGFTNHPKFTIGHLVTAIALVERSLGEKYSVPDGWDELFRRNGPGDPRKPELDVAKYPPKEELISVLKEKYENAVQLIEAIDENNLTENYTWKLDHYMPSLMDVLFFSCHIHFAWHIGQLAEWRRMMGFDSALIKLLKK